MRKVLPFLPIALLVVAALFIADVGVLYIRPYFLPEGFVPPKLASRSVRAIPRSTYASIISRNIFSADGTMPPGVLPAGVDPSKVKELPPVPTSLPLSLIGTIVHSIPERSIAHIDIKGKNKTIAYTPDREIEQMATVVKVERGKVIIRNLNNSRLEYLELDLGSKLSFANKKAVETAAPSELVNQTGANSFSLKRSDVNKQLSDLNSLLMQAASQPVKGADGEIVGWKLLSIQPNSVFTQLGLLPGDTINAVNGENIDSMAKAMELFSALKNSDRINLKINRGGKDESFSYNIAN